MRISLVRHGRPAVDLKSRITGRMFEEWLRAYESAGIESSSSPPGELTRSLASCALIITSPATRAIQSAERLPISAVREICADAAEAPLPWRLNCPVPLRPAAFTVLARVLWLLGVARAEENVGGSPSCRQAGSTALCPRCALWPRRVGRARVYESFSQACAGISRLALLGRPTVWLLVVCSFRLRECVEQRVGAKG